MPSLIVLAAGMGSRYGGLKQLDPMGPNGETVLDYSVFDAIRAGFDRVIFVIRKDFADAFRDGIGARFAGRIRVDYAFQELTDLPEPYEPASGRSKPWGTVHAVRAARDLIDSPFAVINADDFYGADAYVRAAGFLNQCAPDQCAMIAYPLENTLSEHGRVNRGICAVDAAGKLTSVEEFVKIGREDSGVVNGSALDGEIHELDPGALSSMNFWAFPAEFMQGLEAEFLKFLEKHGSSETGECYLPTVVDSMIRDGNISCDVLETTASWFGVTYPEDKPHVVASIRSLIDEGTYPSPLS
ncbi:MAG: NTP transferase domain-containing protein [Luteolibacter sp.]